MYIHKHESNASILSRVIFFYLKSVNFLFCSVYKEISKWVYKLLCECISKYE